MKQLYSRYYAPCVSSMVCMVVMLALHCHVARAELPPGAYQEMQTKAPEVLVIAVGKVETRQTREKWGVRTHVTAAAKVKKVHRSASKLKPGQLIYIRYTHDRHDEPMAGPSQVPVLREGVTYPAFLKFTKNVVIKRKGKPAIVRLFFAPAAGGYSFERVEDASK